MNIKSKLSSILMLGITSCATPYGPESLLGGYDDRTIAKGVYAATFAGNGHTRKDRADDLSLLRACELAKSDGYKKFVVVKSYTGSIMDAYQIPGVLTTSGSFNSYGYSSISIYSPPSIGYIEKPRSGVIIRGLPENSKRGYLVEQVMKQIVDRHKVKIY